MAYDKDKPMYIWPVDMHGPDGNGFVMISHGIRQLEKFGASKDFIRSFQEEAMSADYANLKEVIRTFFNIVVPVTEYHLVEDEEPLRGGEPGPLGRRKDIV
jgi:hypothetical protein